MKDTGVVRKIDELGRVVIPKEIRKNLRISEGDSIEFYISGNQIVLNKYSSFNRLEEEFYSFAKIINEMYKVSVVITDLENVIIAYGKQSNNYIDKPLTPTFTNILLNQALRQANDIEIVRHYIEHDRVFIFPLMSAENSVFGSAIFIEGDRKMDPKDFDVINVLLNFLTRKINL